MERPYTAEEIIEKGLYESAVVLMDDELREELNRELAPCTELEFLTRYMEEHEKRFGEEFTI